MINKFRGYCKIPYEAYSLVVLLGFSGVLKRSFSEVLKISSSRFSGVIVLYRFCWNIENQLWWIWGPSKHGLPSFNGHVYVLILCFHSSLDTRSVIFCPWSNNNSFMFSIAFFCWMTMLTKVYDRHFRCKNKQWKNQILIDFNLVFLEFFDMG